jgi:hypothetical protein
MLHVDIPSPSDVSLLTAHHAFPSVSIYVPTSPLTQEAQASRIEFKNLWRVAAGQLGDSGCTTRDLAEMEEEAADLIDDDAFWEVQANTLAVFLTPEHMLTYRLPSRLQPVVEVADRYYVKPLLRAVTVPQSAFVLALAQGGVRLVEVSADLPAFTVDVPGMPTDVASSAGKSSIADRAPVGRIQGSEGQKVRMRQYARRIDGALRDTLTGRTQPLILASAEPLASIYRSVNTYAHLAEETIEGNPEKLTDADLAQAARGVIDRINEAHLRSLMTKFGAHKAQGRGTADIAEAARAATLGAIAELVVDIDANVPGTIDPDSGAVSLAAEGSAATYGVIDEIIRRAMATGARVIATRAENLPAGAAMVALLRYPLG